MSQKAAGLPSASGRWAFVLALAAFLLAAPLARSQMAVWTCHNNNARTGLNMNETILAPGNVNIATFGKLFTCPVDGLVMAEPLVIPGLQIPGQGTRDVLLIVTDHDSVYAYDANTAGPALWQTNLAPPPEAPSTANEGILGTPVVDTNTLILYCVAATQPGRGATDTNNYLTLHAISITNGVEVTNVVLQASVHGNGGNNNGAGMVFFSAALAQQRPGLALFNGVVYVSCGSGGSPVIDGPHGWVLAYDAATLAQKGVFCTTPNGNDGDIWMGGAAPAIDGAGNVFFATANGPLPSDSPIVNLGLNENNYAVSDVKLSSSNGLSVADFFCPFNAAHLDVYDLEPGSAGVLLLPDEVGSPEHPHLLVSAGKTGTIFLVDRDNMGHFNPVADQSVQSLTNALAGTWSSPAYFNGRIYYHASPPAVSDVLKAFSVANARINPTPDFQSSVHAAYPGATPSVTANGTNNAIVWEITVVGFTESSSLPGTPAVLHAFDAYNLANELYNSGQAGTRDTGPDADHFVIPTIANGKVYVSGSRGVAVYGLGNFDVPAATPVISPPGGNYNGSVTVTLSCATTNAQIFYTLDGSAPSQSALLYAGPLVITNATGVTITAGAFVQGYNPSQVATASFLNVAAARAYRSIGVAFLGVAERGNDGLGLLASDIAGVFPQYGWNNLPAAEGGRPYEGGPLQVADSTGGMTPVTVTWSATEADGTASGNTDGNHKLFKGFIADNGGDPAIGEAGDPPGTPPASVVFKNLQSSTYRVLVYATYNDIDSWNDYWVNGQTNNAFHIVVQGPSFGGAFIRASSVDPDNRQTGNYVQFDSVQAVGGAITVQAAGTPNPNKPWLNLRGLVSAVQLVPWVPPVVTLNSPSNGAAFVADSASVEVSATASSVQGNLTNVSFYSGGGLIGSLKTGPYEFTWTGLLPGQYSLTAVAMADNGLSTTSAPVAFTVSPFYGLTGRQPVPAYLDMPPLSSRPAPLLLSGVGAFADTPSMTPAPGLIPYSVIEPLWSDGASQTRWMAVPNSGPPYTPDSQIQFAETGEWAFPNGTVFVQHFDLNTDETNPSVTRRLETRVLVRSADGAAYGATYKWRADNSDADLVTNSLAESIVITNATGVRTQAWYYPSPPDCLACHTTAASYVLGVKTRQLNCDFTYPGSGVTGNQLRTLNQLGLFYPAIADETAIAAFPALVSSTNASGGLEDRARSYLDANCANCHRPGGASGAGFDARWDTPLSQQGIVNGPVNASLGVDHAAVVVPNDIWRSILYARVDSTNATIKMPPLARNAIDTNAVGVLAEWINNLGATPAVPPPTITPSGGYVPFAPAGIVLDDPDPFASIYYTLDSSLPTTNSALYTGPLLLASGATVTAIAARPGFADSVAVSGAFVSDSFVLVPESYTLASGQFVFAVAGAPAGTYVIQVSPDLVKWTPFATNIVSGGPFTVSDTPGLILGPRFYRVEQP